MIDQCSELGFGMSNPQYAVNSQMEEYEEPNKCLSFLYITWKVLTCIFSHVILVGMVVSYCILGAFTFEHLESENEKQVRHGIKYIRGNITEHIWRLTINSSVLHEANWSRDAVKILHVRVQKYHWVPSMVYDRQWTIWHSLCL